MKLSPLFALLLLMIPGLASAALAFDPAMKRLLPMTSDPAGVALADFNQDGNLDLAVTERGIDSVDVYLGNAVGKYGTRVRYGTGDSPTAIATGDLNQDGLLDLAITNAASNTVTLYLGAAFGAFTNRVDYAVGVTPSGIAIGDANSDTRLDVVVANAGSNTVSILTGKANDNGLTGNTITVATGTGPRAVLVLDVDRDGVYDLVTANWGADSISVRKGLPAGGFGARTDTWASSKPSALASGDLNADGWPDLAIAPSGSTAIMVSLNVNGSFPGVTGYQAASSPDAIAIADFNHDGIPDVVAAHQNSNAVYFYPGNGNGTLGFPNSATANGTGVLSIAFGDVDGDGRRDVVAPTLVPPLLTVIYNNGLGPFGPPVEQPAGTSPQALVVADFNGDTRPDVAVANAGSSNLSTFMNQGDGVLGAHVDVPAPKGPSWLVARDLNGDLKPDLVTATYNSVIDDTNRVSVYLNPGNGAFAAHTDYDAGTVQTRSGLVVGDVTNDGKLDIVVGHGHSTVAQILPGNGLGAFSIGPTLDVFNEPTSIDLADIDGNGSLDAVVGGSASFSTGLISVFLANGAGGFNPRVDYSLPGRPVAIAHADFHGDGQMDVAAVNIGTATVSILAGNGGGALAPGGTLTSPGSQGYSLVVGDVNQDGDLDMVCGRADTYAALNYGTGFGVFSSFSLILAGHGLSGVALAQLDGNATMDLVASNLDTGTISVLRGRNKTRTTLTVSPNPSAIGQSLTYQATVTKAAPDSANPTGTVRFFDGVRLLGSAPLVGNVATLVQNGDLPWDRELSATYVGDGRFFGSFSAPLAHQTYIPTVGVSLPTSATLSLAPLDNPAMGGGVMRVRVSLAGTSGARLTLHDVRGRVLASRAIAQSGVAELSPRERLAAGVYLVRIEQAGQVATARAVVL